MDELCICQLIAINLREILVERVSELSLAEAKHFVPNRNGILTVDQSFTHVQWLEENRVNKLSLYTNRQIQK